MGESKTDSRAAEREVRVRVRDWFCNFGNQTYLFQELIPHSSHTKLHKLRAYIVTNVPFSFLWSIIWCKIWIVLAKQEFDSNEGLPPGQKPCRTQAQKKSLGFRKKGLRRFWIKRSFLKEKKLYGDFFSLHSKFLNKSEGILQVIHLFISNATSSA